MTASERIAASEKFSGQWLLGGLVRIRRSGGVCPTEGERITFRILGKRTYEGTVCKVVGYVEDFGWT